MDRSVGRSRAVGRPKDPLNDLVIPLSRPRPLTRNATRPHTHTHNTQHKQEDGRTDGRTEGCTMAGPDRRGRRREGRGIGDGGTEPLNSQLLRSAKVCLSVCRAAAGWLAPPTKEARSRRRKEHRATFQIRKRIPLQGGERKNAA